MFLLDFQPGAMGDSSSSFRPLVFPETVVIRSDQSPAIITEQERRLPEASTSALPEHGAWKEWAVNPARHGPEHLTRPPIFLPSQSQYDELGRSIVDGVDVLVDIDVKGKGRQIDDGTSVATWYSSLARPGPSRIAATTSPQPPTRASVSNTSDTPVDLTTVDDDDVSDATLENTPSLPPVRPRPVRVHRREWFIRRALVKQATAISQAPSPPSRPSSIASMLNIDPARPPIAHPPQYVLGPDNRGYAMLQDRLGWEGGGLGRPAGWELPALAQARIEPAHDTTKREKATAEKGHAGESTIGVKREKTPELPEEIKVEVKDELEYDEEEVQDNREEMADMLSEEVEVFRPGGPGRTAPIATTLKLDRLGLGHIRSTRPGDVESAKRVTHTAAEIAKAQRRARHAGRAKGGIELGKKGKIKWKDRDKRDREHRQRLAAAINA